MAYSPYISRTRALERFEDYISRVPGEKISKYSHEDYLNIYRKFRDKYKKIVLIGIEFVGIGETIPRVAAYIRDSNMRDRQELWLVMPTFVDYYSKGIVNEAIFEIFAKDVPFITYDNLDYWYWCFRENPDFFDLNEFYIYRAREAKEYIVGKNAEAFAFNEDEMKRGRQYLENMGVSGEFVCLHMREGRTKDVNFINYASTHIADVEVLTYRNACMYLEKCGFRVVRMGKDEVNPCKLPNTIDYANDYYDPWMDFYLCANCKFMIGTEGGFTTLPPYWGRPSLMTNKVQLIYGWEEVPCTQYDMFMPKKFYSEKKGRFLNYYEMLQISELCERTDCEFEKRKIVLSDNTEEEINEAVEEINKRIDGEWTESMEEIDLMNKFNRMVKKFKCDHEIIQGREVAYQVHQNPKYKGYVMQPAMISYSYLKNNQYLIEEY